MVDRQTLGSELREETRASTTTHLPRPLPVPRQTCFSISCGYASEPFRYVVVVQDGRTITNTPLQPILPLLPSSPPHLNRPRTP